MYYYEENEEYNQGLDDNWLQLMHEELVDCLQYWGLRTEESQLVTPHPRLCEDQNEALRFMRRVHLRYRDSWLQLERILQITGGEPRGIDVTQYVDTIAKNGQSFIVSDRDWQRVRLPACGGRLRQAAITALTAADVTSPAKSLSEAAVAVFYNYVWPSSEVIGMRVYDNSICLFYRNETDLTQDVPPATVWGFQVLSKVAGEKDTECFIKSKFWPLAMLADYVNNKEYGDFTDADWCSLAALLEQDPAIGLHGVHVRAICHVVSEYYDATVCSGLRVLMSCELDSERFSFEQPEQVVVYKDKNWPVPLVAHGFVRYEPKEDPCEIMQNAHRIPASARWVIADRCEFERLEDPAIRYGIGVVSISREGKARVEVEPVPNTGDPSVFYTR